MNEWSEAALRERIAMTRYRMSSTVEQIGGQVKTGPDSARAKPRMSPRAHTNHFADNDVGLNELLTRLSSDAVQLVHDELELAKFEVRDVADTLSEDMREAGQYFARDFGRMLVAVSLGFLAALALTFGLILGLGDLLGGAYWAGGLIAGLILAVAAVLFVHVAIHDLRESAAVRFENTMRMIRRGSGAHRTRRSHHVAAPR